MNRVFMIFGLLFFISCSRQTTTEIFYYKYDTNLNRTLIEKLKLNDFKSESVFAEDGKWQIWNRVDNAELLISKANQLYSFNLFNKSLRKLITLDDFNSFSDVFFNTDTIVYCTNYEKYSDNRTFKESSVHFYNFYTSEDILLFKNKKPLNLSSLKIVGFNSLLKRVFISEVGEDQGKYSANYYRFNLNNLNDEKSSRLFLNDDIKTDIMFGSPLIHSSEIVYVRHNLPEYDNTIPYGKVIASQKGSEIWKFDLNTFSNTLLYRNTSNPDTPNLKFESLISNISVNNSNIYFSTPTGFYLLETKTNLYKTLLSLPLVFMEKDVFNAMDRSFTYELLYDDSEFIIFTDNLRTYSNISVYNKLTKLTTNIKTEGKTNLIR